jgi:hypothetical protein
VWGREEKYEEDRGEREGGYRKWREGEEMKMERKEKKQQKRTGRKGKERDKESNTYNKYIVRIVGYIISIICQTSVKRKEVRQRKKKRKEKEEKMIIWWIPSVVPQPNSEAVKVQLKPSSKKFLTIKVVLSETPFEFADFFDCTTKSGFISM